MGILPESYQIVIVPIHYKCGDIIYYDDDIDITSSVVYDQSDYIEEAGLGVIRQEIDTGDFDFGTFTFANLKMKGINVSGRFSSINDNPKSIFRYTRDLAKVQINYFDGTSNTPNLRFNGFVNEDGTKQDFIKNQISFDVLARSSILRKQKVTGGQISNNILFSTAIKRLLNVPEITNNLTYDELNVNVRHDALLQDGSHFDGLPTIDALNELLLVSNSVLIIDSTDTIFVRSRKDNLTTHYFYGPGDYLGRENILSLRRFNDGLQRSFSSIRVNNVEQSDTPWNDDYGIRQKAFDADFVTDPTVLSDVATQLLSSFKVPKIELEIVVKTKDALSVNILDRVGIFYPKRTKPVSAKKIPIYGQRLYNATDEPYPHTFDDMDIPDAIKFKVIGRIENMKDFTTTLKLRQAGEKNVASGYFGYDTSYTFMDGTNYSFMDGTDYEFMEAVT